MPFPRGYDETDDRHPATVSDMGLRLSVMTLQPVMALSAVFFAIGTASSLYLITAADGADTRSVLTAASLLAAACSCVVALMVLRTGRLLGVRSRLVVGSATALASGWLIYSLPTWVADGRWWAVAIGIWAVVVMLATVTLQNLGRRLTGLQARSAAYRRPPGP